MFKDRINKMNYWQGGAFLGAIFGLGLYSLAIPISDSSLVDIYWHIVAKPFCLIFNLELAGEDGCGWFFMLFGWIFLPIAYGLLGALISLTLKRFKK